MVKFNLHYSKNTFFRNSLLILLAALSFIAIGCKPSAKYTVPVRLSPLESANREQLFAQINRLAEVKSIRGKVYVKFEDNTFAESGIAEKYKTANGSVIVQAPDEINLKIEIPAIGTDLVQMTSDGEKFRVAVICCVDEKFKKFVYGTNEADYSRLREQAKDINKSEVGKTINVFASLRPQHFTAALIMRPIEANGDYTYTLSEIHQDEATSESRGAASRVIRGYYLLDELRKTGDNSFEVSRRFWFDRVGGIRLARQQVFDDKNEILADISYGAEQKFTAEGNYSLPVQVQITRPQERYSVKLTYQSPEAVIIGRPYDTAVFQLENKWQLPEVDLDKQQLQQPNPDTKAHQ